MHSERFQATHMQLNITAIDWEDLKKYIYCVDGSLPDIFVLNTTRADWQSWVQYANANYRVTFRDQHHQEHDKIDFSALLNYWDGDFQDEIPFASVFVGHIQVNCFFNSDDIILNDIDPKEIASMGDHLQLMEYLMGIAKTLSKQVFLVAEGSRMDAYHKLDIEPLITADQEEAYADAYWLDALH